MLEMVKARENDGQIEERYDLFSGLLDAAQDETDNGVGLSDEELIGRYLTLQLLESVLLFLLGNMFIFLIAGHEVRSSPSSNGVASQHFTQTTAHTLCFTFALLALYPDEQECLYQEIKGVMSSLNRMPVGFRNLNSCR